MSSQEQILILQRQVDALQRQVNMFMYPSLYRFTHPVTGGPDGLKFGTSTKDKMNFYGATPVVQYDGVTFNGVPGASYTAVEAATLAGLRTALLYYNLIHA